MIPATLIVRAEALFASSLQPSDDPMSVRDEDIEMRRFRPVLPYGASSDVAVPSWAAQLIAEQVERSPQSWTPRLVREPPQELT